MINVNLSDLREGDIVLVRGTVGNPHRPTSDERNVGIVFNHEGAGRATHYVQANAIVSHERRRLAVGDRVKMGCRPQGGAIMHVGAERAFVQWDRSGQCLLGEETATLLTHLERA